MSAFSFCNGFFWFSRSWKSNLSFLQITSHLACSPSFEDFVYVSLRYLVFGSCSSLSAPCSPLMDEQALQVLMSLLPVQILYFFPFFRDFLYCTGFLRIKLQVSGSDFCQGCCVFSLCRIPVSHSRFW